MTIQIITTPEAMQEVFNEAFEKALKQFNKSNLETSALESNDRFSISELADYLKCTKATIHAYKNRGVIPFYQTGRTVYFIKSEVDTALAANNKKGAQR